MNERIKELLDEAQGSIDPMQQDANVFEKFAEMIIREYEQFLPIMCPWDKAEEEGPMKGWHVKFVARKHFGVE